VVILNLISLLIKWIIGQNCWIRKSNNSTEIYNNYSDLLFKRWGDVESGRWNPPDLSDSGRTRKYFGVR